MFNLNGIVAKSPRKLIVVDSNSGELFRIKLNDDGDEIDEIDQIEGATVQGGDGMLLDRGKLVVVQGNPAQLVFLKLRHGAREATIKRTQTSENLHGPSTVDRAKKLYLVVNADFANTQPTRTVAGLPRKAKHDRATSTATTAAMAVATTRTAATAVPARAPRLARAEPERPRRLTAAGASRSRTTRTAAPRAR